MNFACSTCLESFTSKSDISSVPCGHVFHTHCIQEWLKNGQSNCSQCRKTCHQNQIVKLYFSQSGTEDDFFFDVEETNLKLRQAASKANEECLKFQQENLRLKDENLSLTHENLRLSQHLHNLKVNSSNIEKNLKEKIIYFTMRDKRIQKAEEENSKLKLENLRLSKQLDDLNNVEKNLKEKCMKLTKREQEMRNLISTLHFMTIQSSESGSEISPPNSSEVNPIESPEEVLENFRKL